MARTNNLHNYLEDVATAIKDKKGDQTPIKASDFDTEIANLPSGGGDDVSNYFITELNENTSGTASYKFDNFKKALELKIGDNVTSLAYLFYNYNYAGSKQVNYLPTIIGGKNVINMSYLYAYNGTRDSYVKYIDISKLDTSNATNMSYMFKDRSVLEPLDFSNLDFSKVKNVYYMFYRYGSDNAYEFEINLSNFTPNNIDDIRGMFNSCGASKIDLRNLTIADKTDVRTTFQYCYKLKELYLDNLDTTKISSAYYSGMFTSCGSLLPSGELTKVYVKDETAQNWVLTAGNGRPTTWTTDNVIIAGSEQDLRER